MENWLRDSDDDIFRPTHGSPNFGYQDDSDDFIERAQELFMVGGLQAELRAQKLLEAVSFKPTANWNQIHAEGNHTLSNEGAPNVFFVEFILGALTIRRRVGRRLRLVEIGSGNGRDAFAYAKSLTCEVIGIDSSSKVVDAARERARKECVYNTRFVLGDYKELLADSTDNLRGMIDVILACSATHYDPPEVQKRIVLPLIANALPDDGQFFCAVKSSESDSARKRQLVLHQFYGYTGTLDEKDRLARYYPDMEEAIIDVFSPSFGEIDIEKRLVRGYDDPLGSEIFFCIKASEPLRTCLPRSEIF